ncbi:MAG: hypothetical protein QG551_153 [Patescibacteria group bacterium]|nr:hypothetical protein [Patescibacteria group bacterium]
MKNINNTIKYFLVLVAAFLFIGIPAALAEGRTDTEVDTLNPSQILATSAYLNAFISPSDDQGIFTGNHTEAWFEWGTDSDSMGNATTSNNIGQAPRNYSKYFSGLEQGQRYYYQAVASNLDGITRGGIRSFVAGDPNSGQIDSDNDNNDNDNNNSNGDEVSTLSATSIEEDSVRLRGEVDNGDNVDVWFVMDNNDSSPSCDDDDIEYSVSGDFDEGDEFSKTVSGLDSDEKYYFRACTDDDSGNVSSFTTDDDNSSSNDDDNDNNGDELVAITTTATGVTTSSAYMNGLAILDGSSTTGWFEYGTTTSLGNRTPNQSIGSNGSSSVSRQILGLQSNTQYYFRLVLQNSNATDYGDTQIFFTQKVAVTNTGTPTGGTNEPSTVVTSSSNYLDLEITSNFDKVSVGDVVTYTVTFKNISGYDLTNVLLRVEFPSEMKFRKTTLGNYSRSNKSVIVPLEKVLKGTSGEFIVLADVLRSAKKETILVTAFEGIHDNPTVKNAEVTTIDYSIIEVDKGASNLGAGLIFSGAFFPGSLIGWLLIVLIIVVIILIARAVSNKKAEEEENKKKEIKIS